MNKKDYFSHTCIDKIREIAQPLCQDSPIKFLDFSKIYSSGFFCSLNTEKDWIFNYREKYLKKETTNPRLKPGVNYWKNYTDQRLLVVADDARNNFDIDARIEFVYRNEIEDCYYKYSFFSNTRDADTAHKFYTIHIKLFILF